MGTELHAVFVHLSDVLQREYLKTSAVGEYRLVPHVELMQSACAFKDIESGAKVQMVGVAKYYLCFDIILQVRYLYSFYRAYGSYRHEYGGLYLTMVGCEHAGTCFASAVGM